MQRALVPSESRASFPTLAVRRIDRYHGRSQSGDEAPDCEWQAESALYGDSASTDTWDEQALVACAQRGSTDAFNALTLRYQSQVYNLALHILRDPAGADDATQETFISAYGALSRFHGGSFRAWLLRIVANACYDELRWGRRRPQASWEAFGDLDEDANPYLADPRLGPEAWVQQQELGRDLAGVLAGLPERQRTTLVLVDYLGLTYEEAAQVTGVPMGTVKSRLARARDDLRTRLRLAPDLLIGRNVGS